MGDVEHAAQLVFQHVGGKVSAAVAAAGQVVVGQRSRPHDLRPGVVIVGMGVQPDGFLLDGAQQRSRGFLGGAHIVARRFHAPAEGA